MNVGAADDSLVAAAAGGLAGTTGGTGIGASVGYNSITNGILAEIDAAAVKSTQGSVAVTANSKPMLAALGVAGAGGMAVSGAGSIDINSIGNDVAAYIKNSIVIAGNDVSVQADEASSLYAASLAGAISSDSSAIGAQIAYNYVGGSISPFDPNVLVFFGGTVAGAKDPNLSSDSSTATSNVTAYIDGSSVDAGGQVIVTSGFDNPDSSSQGPSDVATSTIDPSQVSVTDNAIVFEGSTGLVTGDQIVYHANGGTPIGGLVDGQAYYVLVLNSTTVKLASSLSNLYSDTVIPLGSTGNSAQTFFKANAPAALTFNPAGGQTLSGNQLQFTSPHNLATGDTVVYRNNGGPNIGLVDGQTYYVIRIDAYTIELAATESDALNQVAIPLSKPIGTSTILQTLTPILNNALAPVAILLANAAADEISFGSDPNLQTGDAVVYHANTGQAISGLADATTYFAIRVDATHYRLAATVADAMNDHWLPLAGTGNAGQTLVTKLKAVSLWGSTLTLPTAISSQIYSVTAAGAGGNTVSGAGAIGIDFVREQVDAYISNTPANQSVLGTAGVSVLANDTSHVRTATGSLAISTDASAINGSVGINDIQNTVRAHIDGAVVSSNNGAITVAASETAQDLARLLAARRPAEATARPSAGPSPITKSKTRSMRHVSDNPVELQNAGSTAGATPSSLAADGAVSVTATDMPVIATLAGNVSGSFGGTLAVGLAFAINQIADTDTATVSDSTVQSNTANINVGAALWQAG